MSLSSVDSRVRVLVASNSSILVAESSDRVELYFFSILVRSRSTLAAVIVTSSILNLVAWSSAWRSAIVRRCSVISAWREEEAVAGRHSA